MPIQFGPNVVIAGRFRLNRQLGRGGMGSVWHATHLGLDVPCAVKFIEGEIAALPEAQARFEREAKSAASLRSPNVVQILDHGVYEGAPYIAMELLEGEDLGKRLSRIGRMPAFELVRIVMQVTRALAKAHAMGIVHRDLKPDNIFLVHDDEREIAKVLDFGIAKASTTSIVGTTTKTGAMLGTPYYMSPEQAQGTKAVDHRSDLWSLAIIIFQALTGKLPFESEALGDLLIKIIVAPIPMPSQIVGDLPPAFDRWWVKASQRDPAQRWQSAKELAEGLGQAFGLSPGASVVEAPGRASYGIGDPAFPMTGQTGPALQGQLPAATPAFAQTPSGPGMARPGSQPGFGMTPGHAPMAPQGFGVTPGHPGMPPAGFGITPGQQAIAPGSAQPTTGTPLARSLLGAPEIPRHSRTGLWLALGAGLIAVIALSAVGVSIATRGKHASAAATSAAAQYSAGSVTPPAAAPTTPAQPGPVATLVESPPPAAETASTPGSASAQPVAKPAKPTSPSAPQPPSPKPAPAPAPAKPSKGKPAVDLGI
jgi:serine/threonine-protein kinase